MMMSFRRRLGRLGLAFAAVFVLSACSKLPLPVNTPVAYTDQEVTFSYPDNFTVKRVMNNGKPRYEFRIKRLAFMDNQSTAAKRKSSLCIMDFGDIGATNPNWEGRLSTLLTINVLNSYKTTTEISAVDPPEELDALVLARATGGFTISGTHSTYRSGVLQSTRKIQAPFRTSGQISSFGPTVPQNSFATIQCFHDERFQNLVDALFGRVARTITKT